MREFEERPSGLHLPSNLVLKRLDGDRITRVAWKLVRGLYFLETGSVLAEVSERLSSGSSRFRTAHAICGR